MFVAQSGSGLSLLEEGPTLLTSSGLKSNISDMKNRMQRARAPSPWAYRAGWRLDFDEKGVAKKGAELPLQRHVRTCRHRPGAPQVVAQDDDEVKYRDSRRDRWQALKHGPGVAKPWGRAPSPWAYRSLYSRRAKAPLTQLLREPGASPIQAALPLRKRRARSAPHPLSVLAAAIARSGTSIDKLDSKEISSGTQGTIDNLLSPAASEPDQRRLQLLEELLAEASTPQLWQQPQLEIKRREHVAEASSYANPFRLVAYVLESALFGSGIACCASRESR